MRVIAGSLKGRRLKTPTWDGLRPTSDKLRETLFNILGARVQGARVLDGFAGTGAIGIVALSRGATFVTFIDSDRRAAALVEENLRTCRVDGGYVVERGTVAAVIGQQKDGEPYDIIVLDPPYEYGRLESAVAGAAGQRGAGGIVVLEHAARVTPPQPDGITLTRTVTSGDSALTFYS